MTPRTQSHPMDKAIRIPGTYLECPRRTARPLTDADGNDATPLDTTHPESE